MSHDDPVDEVERSLIQLPYLLAQGIETAARVRVMRAERREHADRAAAEADVCGAAETARRLQEERGRAHPVWERANDRDWLRAAEPFELFEAWSTATAWQEHDRGAAAGAQRAEGEMRRRWPDQMRLFDDARAAGLPGQDAMRNMLTTAGNAGWDPTRTARPQPAPHVRPALPGGRGGGDSAPVRAAAGYERTADAATNIADEPRTAVDEHPARLRTAGVHEQGAHNLTAMERATRFLPPLPKTASIAAPTPVPSRPIRPRPRTR